jgi:gliding motility-associated lipoprotein GldD
MVFAKYITGISLITALLIACNSEYHPEIKKKGYFNIEFPAKEYRAFDQPGYPYTFEYPVYAIVVKDSVFFSDKAEDYWINIDVPRFGGRIYISYKEVGRNNFDSLVNDGFKMAYKQHTEVSTGIEDSVMRTPNGVEGIYYSLSYG